MPDRSPLADPAGSRPETRTTWGYRLRYSRTEPAIWLAHLDMMRTFERAVRRAGWPVAWSGGYNPRPQLTFALPIGVSLATEDDYLDIQLTEDRSPAWLLESLNRSLPAGLALTAAGRLDAGGPSLMSLVREAEYVLQHPGLGQAWQTLQQQIPTGPLPVEKKGRSKARELDIRPLLIFVRTGEEDTLHIRVLAGSSQNLRPDLFLQALVRYGNLPPLAADDTRRCRRRLWLADLQNEGLISPLQLAQEVVFQ